ncbi:ABC transporter substrate-binding protein [Ruania alba]|uniref:Carbohydrate ABC transporter substrate-binding protein, CUT1 family n=1 Tax=Ruania alba TaxID=648782 RepID=A0A1H5LK11_9MICO|nr:ABC transporter substrate-binding protein [Ruania alba]SEE77340.1 carbohydrate ABC transporter substrate-binding protein, CUT1 family [Ruania alba]
MNPSSFRRRRLGVGAASVAAAALVLSACSGGGSDDGSVEITFLSTSDEDNTALAEALIEAFEAENPDITVNLDGRPGGTEGDNLIKTRLATGEMAEVFNYNSGSLFQALNPDQNLLDLSDRPWVENLTDDFTSVVSTENGIYGGSYGSSFAGGIVYNGAIYDELGLEVPESWDDFMANNEEIAAAGYDPIVQTYGDTWTSQLFVLGDYANVHAADPEWAEQYTAHERFYADEPALAGFRHHQEAYESGYFNENYPSATFEDGGAMLAEGTGVHYPILTTILSSIRFNHPDAVEDMRFMAIPADDPANTSATIWQPDGLYVPNSVEGAERDAALAFVDFVTGPDACSVFIEAVNPTGPYVNGCELPADVPPLVQDVQSYFDAGNTAPALEFLSPIKGPNLENITVEVGSGIRDAEEAAANYDRDVENQARQLGLEGW